MGYDARPFPSFSGGLNLRDEPSAVAATEAIDCLNVIYTTRGAVEQRTGYDALTAALTNAAATLHPYYRTSTADAQIVAGCGTRLEGINSSGTVLASATGLTDGTWGFARYGTPGNEVVYAGQGSANLNKWDGSAWTTNIASTPDAGALCVMGVSNRLVAARFNTTTGGPTGGAGTSSPSHVYFSDEGLPETWLTNDYIQITPGDGEKIQAVVAWRDLVFVFKETKFAVVYGESVDGLGEAEFNFRMVETGAGALGPKAVVAGTDGVYFAGRHGIYRTTGGEPEILSEIIDPVFDSSTSLSDFFLGGRLLHSEADNTALCWLNDRLYVSFTSAGTANNYTLVWDSNLGWWTLWDIPIAHAIPFRRSAAPELVFADTTNKKIYYHNLQISNDDDAAIVSRWRSGWEDYGVGSAKVIRESKAWGTGIVTMSVSYDYAQGTGEAALLDMTPTGATGSDFGGTGSFGGDGFFGDLTAAVTPVVSRKSVRGTVFSTSFTNSTLNQGWAMHRLQHHLRNARRPSVKQTEPQTSP